MEPAISNMEKVLRHMQEKDSVLGPFFKAIHTFTDRTIEEFFSDTPSLPYPVIAMEKDRTGRLGYYTEKDGYTLIHRINLNPFSLRNGEEAAETLAHELVHLWQAHIGRPIKRNYHNTEFHLRMAQYGISTAGKAGRHMGYANVTWPNWMVENADLELAKFLLPGSEKVTKPKRKLFKHRCPDCGVNFRNRNHLDVVCLPCGVPFEVVNS